VVSSTGVLQKHGWSDSHPPCTGPGKLHLRVAIPVAPAILDELGSQIGASVVVPCVSYHLEEFEFIAPRGTLLKRIPKGARQRASIVFEGCIRRILADGINLELWKRLFLFPAFSTQPKREGKRSYLTSRIQAQLQLFNVGGLLKISKPQHRKVHPSGWQMGTYTEPFSPWAQKTLTPCLILHAWPCLKPNIQSAHRTGVQYLLQLCPLFRFSMWRF